MQNPKTRYVFEGFSQASEFRVFTFEGIASDSTRTIYTVRADLAMSRRYGIQIQELPRLCLELLEGGLHASERALTYSEEDMWRFAQSEQARRSASRSSHVPRRPPPENSGSAWRVPFR